MIWPSGGLHLVTDKTKKHNKPCAEQEPHLAHGRVDNPLTPVLPVTNLGLSSSSDAITFDRNWHHLYSTSAGGKDDAQIRVIG